MCYEASRRIFKWDSKFSPSKESPIAPVWIRIEGLPLYLFEGNSLCSISNAIGNPLRIDPRNINRAILSSARICVELDVSKPCIDSIWISIIDEVTKVSIDGFWVKVLYDFVPPYCTACSHIGHGRDYCKLSAADQVFDNLPQTDTLVESAPEGNATAQRIVKSSCDAQSSIPDVPSSSYTVPFCQQQDMRSKHTKYWIERKGTRSLKSQLQNTSHKDKALSIENSFSVLDVEQKEGITKEFQSNFQKVLQVEMVELAEADLEKKVQPNQARQEVEGSALLVASDVSSPGDNIEVVPAAVSSSEQIVEGSALLVAPVVCSSGDKNEMAPAAFSSSKQIGEIIVCRLEAESVSDSVQSSGVPDTVSPVASVVLMKEVLSEQSGVKVDLQTRNVAVLKKPKSKLQNIAVSSEQPSQITQASDVIPANVASIEQIGGLAPVNSMTQVSLLTSSTSSKSWANMVEEEEQEDMKIAQLKVQTIENPNIKLVKSSGPETIKDLNTAPGKAHFSERVAQIDHNEGLAMQQVQHEKDPFSGRESSPSALFCFAAACQQVVAFQNRLEQVTQGAISASQAVLGDKLCGEVGKSVELPLRLDCANRLDVNTFIKDIEDITHKIEKADNTIIAQIAESPSTKVFLRHHFQSRSFSPVPMTDLMEAQSEKANRQLTKIAWADLAEEEPEQGYETQGAQKWSTTVQIAQIGARPGIVKAALLHLQEKRRITEMGDQGLPIDDKG